MGLIRKTIKLLPYAAAGILGYYIGTIKSDQYEGLFENRCSTEYNMQMENNEKSELENKISKEIKNEVNKHG